MSANGKRWDLIVSSKIEGSDKQRYTRVGIVFMNEEKGSLAIKLDPGVAIVSTPGVYINGFLPREPGTYAPPAAPAGGGYQQRPPAGGGYQQRAPQGNDDNIPF
jgi:hypothetical protein